MENKDKTLLKQQLSNFILKLGFLKVLKKKNLYRVPKAASHKDFTDFNIKYTSLCFMDKIKMS